MSISLNYIVQTFKNKLFGNANLNAYCQTNFAKDLTVILVNELISPPSDDKCPYVIIHPKKVKDRPEIAGKSPAKSLYTVRINWSIKNLTKTDTESFADYAGVQQIDELGDKIWQELKTIPTATTFRRNVYKIEPLQSFPIFTGSMDIEIDVPELLGGYSLSEL